MANPRQRRKARSSSTLKPSINAKKQMRKRLARAPTVHGADVLKDNYDPKLTLRQNYARLGLVPSLDVRPDTGGVERAPAAPSASREAEGEKPRKGMAKVVRDEQGNIVDIVEADAEEEGETAWGKPLTSVADDEVETYMPTSGAKKGENKVLASLEDMAAQAAPVERHTSSLEAQWLQDLVAKYGEDTESMARDRKLNVWQKTQGEIKRAIKKAGGFAAFRSQ
ncbi:Ribosome biogenesis protein Nop16 [Kalmanozyma brasiliensis GHG001]|uniref:Nucleolar protein 16 n=1 Tax=Kalmanozyma brasiliensis (strain GHG001) TaxID=1365824 RepID=V5GUW6_KALBG|nr:Ribosome biogenesis protein Nop16 [Kalmanozyma brasiliensis GHG001]EST09707.1 Ribosome biogenesis protein Nop16 [Kalmanozyma brasiliensis GHG001]